MNEPLIRMERNKYEAVQCTPLSEEKLRNTYWENTMFARLGIEALVSRLLTQIQHFYSAGAHCIGRVVYICLHFHQ